MGSAPKAPTRRVGSLWEIEAEGRVRVTRPDGSTATFTANKGIGRHVLAMAGKYTAELEDETVIEVVAK